MRNLFDLLQQFGASTADVLWFPLLIWTAVASLVFLVLRTQSSINPLYQYHIRVATLIALPMGMIAAVLLQLYTVSMSSSVLNNSIFTVENPLPAIYASSAGTVNVEASLNWLDPNFIIGLVSALFIVIAFIMIVRLVISYFQLRVLHKSLSSEPLTNIEYKNGLKDGSVSVAFHSHPLVPFTFGWSKPLIVLPEKIKADKQKLDMAIQHELVHIRRGDYLLQLAISLIQSVFWFHPLINIGSREIETYREISCDQEVLNTSDIHPKKYANLLLELIPLNKEYGSFTVSMAVKQSTLKQRIETMKHHKMHKTSFKRSLFFLLTITLMIITPIACSDLQGPDGISPEELAESKFEMRGISMTINGKEVLKQSAGAGAMATGLAALYIKAGEYGYFKFSPMRFEGGTLAGSINDRELNFTINSLNVEIKSETNFLDIAREADVWVEHYPEKFNGFTHGVMKTQTSLEQLISDQEQRLGNNPPPPPSPSDSDLPENTFVVVENMPELQGGRVGIQSKVEYPQVAIRAGIEGRVTVQFIVDKNGNVVNPKVIRGIGGGCDEEALRVISQAKFTPGQQRGRNVAVQMSLPVLFKLTNSDYKISDYETPLPPQPMKIETLESSNGRVKVKLSSVYGPLVGATVLVKDTNRGVATDSEGIATISGLEKGTYTFEFSYVGFGKPVKEITVN